MREATREAAVETGVDWDKTHVYLGTSCSGIEGAGNSRGVGKKSIDK